MAQEDQKQSYSNISSCGGVGGGGAHKSSKKLKQKKIPQRGLGVAQLEKIRLDELEKKAAVAAAAAAGGPVQFSSPTSVSPTSSHLSANLPNYNQNHPSSSIPLATTVPSDFPSANAQYRPAPLIPSANVHHLNSAGLLNLVNGAGIRVDAGRTRVPPVGHGNVPKVWNHEGESPRLDHGFAYRVNVPFESNPNWPLPVVMGGTQQCQPPSPMVNVPTGTSTSPVLNFQMEPPSNQSYRSNHAPIWPEEEKVVGVKRLYPFSVDNPPSPTFNCKLPATAHPISRSDDSASCSNAGSFNFEPGSSIRESGSCSTSMPVTNLTMIMNEHGVLDGDFLTLGPPRTSSPFPSPKFKHPPPFLASHNHEFPKSLPHEGSMEDTIPYRGPNGSILQQPFYIFIPPANSQNGQAAANMNNSNVEEGESVDLNLKL